MDAPRIGVWLDSYRRAFKDALRAAAADGFGLFQAGALDGLLRPAELSSTGRRHLLRHLNDLALRLDGLALEFPDQGLAAPAFVERRLSIVREAVTLAHDVRATRVVVRSGGFSEGASSALLLGVLETLAELSDRSGVIVAVHPADASVHEAAVRIREIGCATLCVAVDTLDAPDASELEHTAFAGSIGSVTLRDARRRGRSVEQTPFGSGEVDFRRLLSALDQAGYRGPLILRDDSGAGATLSQGRVFLQSILGLHV